MKKMEMMLEEYGRLKRELEKNGYSGIVQYEQVPLRNRILCRLVQSVIVACFVMLLLTAGMPQDVFAGRADVWEVLLTATATLPIIWVVWVVVHGVIDWFFRTVIGKPSLRLKLLPVSGYYAKRKIQTETERLRTEIAQLNEKTGRLEPILEKISEAAMIIEYQLGGETELVREVGENPHFKVLVVKDKVLAKIIQSDDDVLEEYDESIMSVFTNQYIRLSYDLFREGACAELLYNVAILLEWKKTKAAERENAKKFAEEVKRSK